MESPGWISRSLLAVLGIWHVVVAALANPKWAWGSLHETSSGDCCIRFVPLIGAFKRGTPIRADYPRTYGLPFFKELFLEGPAVFAGLQRNIGTSIIAVPCFSPEIRCCCQVGWSFEGANWVLLWLLASSIFACSRQSGFFSHPHGSGNERCTHFGMLS